MSWLKQKKPPIREKRLNTLGAYSGDAKTVFDEIKEKEVKQRIRTFSQNSFDEIISVLRLINGIYDAVTVIHGPRGCGAAQLFLNTVDDTGNRWAVTNLDERDTIMGGDEKLRQAVVDLHRNYKPQVIFVVATPVVAINNDDIIAVIEELQEELAVTIVPIFSDGFKSKNAITGYDVALHALAKYLLTDKKEESGDFINLIATSENIQDLREVQRLLNELGLKVTIIPRFANQQKFSRAVQAKLSVSINADTSHYLGWALEKKYGIPYQQSELPLGIKGTYQWLSAIGEKLCLQNEIDQLHDKESKQLLSNINKSKFKNTKVYIDLSTSTALGLIDLVEELGAEVVGLTIPHVDILHEKKLAEILHDKPAMQLHVAEGQPFEIANILQKLKPDLYIGATGQPVWAAKLGIPSISVEGLGILGYRGIIRFVHQVNKALQNKSFIRKLAKNTVLPYQNNWYQKSSNWHIKLEVK